MTAIIAASGQVESLRAAFPAIQVVPAASAAAPGEPAVIWLEELDAAEVAHLETLLQDAGEGSIAVYGQHWDGFTAVPLAACVRGVIGGLGHAGIRAALRVIEEGR
ncbi:MAG: hypothetical protein U5Q44_02730 [Dehalococcoidia bacterium]|nr:hypothetical protein [Dehalococcoidia bacterium]